MSNKIIIISPNENVSDDFFEYELNPGEFHDEILNSYCMQNNLEHSDIINLSKDGYIIIYVCNDLALIFSTDVPSEQQLSNIKIFFDRESCKNVKVSFLDNIVEGNVKSYDEFLQELNNINLKKEGMGNVR